MKAAIYERAVVKHLDVTNAKKNLLRCLIFLSTWGHMRRKKKFMEFDRGWWLNALKLCENIINTIKSVHPVKDPVDASHLKALSKHHRSIHIPLVPNYFNVCQLIHFTEHTFNWSCLGCSTNMAAGDKLVEKRGLPTPFMSYDFCILISLIYCLALI